MKKMPWIVFDMDEVIVNGRDVLAVSLSQHSGKNISANDWHQYDLCATYDVDLPTLISIFHSSNMLETATLEPDALQAMVLAKSHGYNIGVLTARGWHEKGLELTRAAIESFGLPVDHIVAVPLDAKKHDVIDLHFPGGIAGFVDDNPSHIRGVSNIGIPSYVRDRPWNRDLIEYDRVHTLVDFVQRVHQAHQAKSEFSSGFSI